MDKFTFNFVDAWEFRNYMGEKQYQTVARILSGENVDKLVESGMLVIHDGAPTRLCHNHDSRDDINFKMQQNALIRQALMQDAPDFQECFRMEFERAVHLGDVTPKAPSAETIIRIIGFDPRN